MIRTLELDIWKLSREKGESMNLYTFVLCIVVLASFAVASPSEQISEADSSEEINEADPSEEIYEADPGEQNNEDFAKRLEKLQKKGWWWGKKKKSSRRDTDVSREFSVLTCALSGSLSSSKKCNKRGLLPYAPYGIKHSLIQIGNTCYEWGKWNFVRADACNGAQIGCCYQNASRKYRGYTKCANRVGEFNEAWDRKKSYGWWSDNCQRHTNAMKDFLLNCYSNAADAVP